MRILKKFNMHHSITKYGDKPLGHSSIEGPRESLLGELTPNREKGRKE